LLDELDHISSTQALESIFSLAHAHSDKLRLIGIANTHTLTSMSSSAMDYSDLGVQTLHFAPYTSDNLLAIVKSRLSPILTSPGLEREARKFLPPSTLMLLSKKVAAHTGDVRTIFEILRGAMDLAVGSLPLPSSPKPTTQEERDEMPSVTPAHVLSALKAYSPSSGSRDTSTSITSELIAKVRNLGLQARLALLSLSLAIKRVESGLSIHDTPASPKKSRSPTKRTSSSFTFTCPSSLVRSCVDSPSLYGYYVGLISSTRSDTFTPVSRSEFSDLLGVLETNGLVSLFGSSTSAKAGPARNGFKRSASLSGVTAKISGEYVRWAEGTRLDEVLRGLGIEDRIESSNDEGSSDIMAEELRAIHTKELLKIQRSSKATIGAMNHDVFDDAMED
jgi:cell division control protein 6